MINPQEEKDVVLILYRKSLSPIHIAEYYHCDLQIILDILGLKGTKKQIDRMHREKNFYDHGYGVEKMFEMQPEWYGKFLHEGDFEKYQSFCYMSHFNPIFWITKFLVHRIPKTTNDISEARRIWILMRFEKYQEVKWGEYNKKIIFHIRNI